MKDFFIASYESLKREKPSDMLDLYSVFLFPILIFSLNLGYLISVTTLLKGNYIIIDQFLAGIFFFGGWVFFPLIKSIYTRTLSKETISSMLFMSIGLYSTLLGNLVLYFIWLFIILFIGTEPFFKIKKMQWFSSLALLYDRFFPKI